MLFQENVTTINKSKNNKVHYKYISHQVWRAAPNKSHNLRSPITLINIINHETLPSFLGIYNGKLSEPNLKEFVESADFILMLGVKLTDSSTGAFTHHLNENKMISLNIDEGKIFNESIQNFDFESLISSLLDLSEIEYKGKYI